jgi:hypothetical protein
VQAIGTRIAKTPAMSLLLASGRRAFWLNVLVASLGVLPRANAGDASSVRIAAASSDGKRAAIFNLTNDYPNGTGALIAIDGKPTDEALSKPLATASTGTSGEKVAPYAKWQWQTRAPDLARLIPFTDAYDDKSRGGRARITIDPDTRLARIEILQSERWWPVKAMPGSWPTLTGSLVVPGRYLIRTHHRADYSDWDEVSAITEEEVPQSEARWQKARAEARTSTASLRQLRATGARPFTKRPRGVRDGDGWDYRRAKALDPAIEKWAIAAAYGPLLRDDIRDMIWLLDAREAPGHKLLALRLVTALRERDPRAADAVLVELEQDPDTTELVPLLRSVRDPLRRLPDPTTETLTTADLTPLTNDELLWLHRAVRAQGRFRFSDPALMEYFSLFAWYRPVSQKTWQKLLVDKFFLKDPDQSALSYRSLTLQAIVELEKVRGLAKPEL